MEKKLYSRPYMTVERFLPNSNKQIFKQFEQRDRFYNESLEPRFKPFNPEFLQNKEIFRPYNGISTEPNAEFGFTGNRRFNLYPRYPGY